MGIRVKSPEVEVIKNGNEWIIKGDCNKAICRVVNSSDHALEIYARMQIKALCDKEIYKDTKIVLMPDTHPGKVGPIGLTMKVNNDTPIMPSLIGTDIGCGMSTVKFSTKHKLTTSDFQKLDTVIRDNIKSNNSFADSFIGSDYISSLGDWVNTKAAKRNIGTLGGGNHFVEIDTNDDGEYYLTVHSGSRSVGGDTYTYFMDMGRKELTEESPYEDITVSGELKDRYFEALNMCLEYANLNRSIMIEAILSNMKWKKDSDIVNNIHNYIAFGDNGDIIIHKGSISAKKGEKVIIPINMKDGIILGIGKGNEEWNCSAPHGAGRIYKRSDVRKHATLTMYKESMEGIYSPSIAANTLDESPFAYRGIDFIKDAISDTVEITNIIKPVYNYKNGGN